MLNEYIVYSNIWYADWIICMNYMRSMWSGWLDNYRGWVVQLSCGSSIGHISFRVNKKVVWPILWTLSVVEYTPQGLQGLVGLTVWRYTRSDRMVHLCWWTIHGLHEAATHFFKDIFYSCLKNLNFIYDRLPLEENVWYQL